MRPSACSAIAELEPPKAVVTLPPAPKQLSRPPVGGGVAHVTVTLVTSAPAIVPLLFVTTQICEGWVGCVATVTEYGIPLAKGIVKKNPPLPGLRSLVPRFCSTSPLPTRPETVPPMRKLVGGGGGVLSSSLIVSTALEFCPSVAQPPG